MKEFKLNPILKYWTIFALLILGPLGVYVKFAETLWVYTIGFWILGWPLLLLVPDKYLD